MASITVKGKTGDFLIGRDSHYTMHCLFETKETMVQESFGKDVSQLMSALNDVEDFHGIDRTTWHEGPEGQLGEPEESTHSHMVVNIGGDTEDVGHLRDAVDRLREAGGVDPYPWRTVPALDEPFDSQRNAVSALHLLEFKLAIGRILSASEWSRGELTFGQSFVASGFNAGEVIKTVSFSGWRRAASSRDDARETVEEILRTAPFFTVGISFKTIGRIERTKIFGRGGGDEDVQTPGSVPTSDIDELGSLSTVWTPGIQGFETDPVFPDNVNSTDPTAYKRAGVTISILRQDDPEGTDTLEPFEEKFDGYWNIQARSEPSVTIVPFVGIPLASALVTEYYSEIQGSGVTERRFTNYLSDRYGLGGQAQQVGGDFCNDYTIQTFSEVQSVLPGKPDSLILTEFRGITPFVRIGYPRGVIPGSSLGGDIFIPLNNYTPAEGSTIGYLTGDGEGETESVRGPCWPPDKVDPTTDCPQIQYTAQALQAPDDISNYDWQGLSSDPLLGKDPATIGDDPGDHDELYEFIATHGGIFDPTTVPPASWRKYLFMFPTQLDKIDYMETLNPGLSGETDFSWMPQSISRKFRSFLDKDITPPESMAGYERQVNKSVFVRAESTGSMGHRIHADLSLPPFSSGNDEWLYWKKDDGAAGSPFEEVVRRVS